MRPSLAVAAVAFLAVLPAETRAADAAKNVLILRGESPDAPGGTIVVDAIESTLRRTSTVPVEFYIESVETGRFNLGAYEERLADLIAEKYADVHLDLVVAFTQASAQFVLRVRPALFPQVPLLIGLVEPRMIEAADLPPAASVVYVGVDAAGTVRLAQRLYPSMRRVLVVNGTSPFDHGWERLVREQLRDVDAAVPIAFDNDSSLDDLARRVAALPPDTVILFVSMMRDGTGAPTQPLQALHTLRASASVPIFGLSSTYVGQGAIAGSVLDFRGHGADLGRRAARMLAGETPPPMTTPPAVMADWRELEHVDGAASRLPATALVLYRDPGLWDQQKGPIVIAAVVLLAQAALIVALVRAGTRRRHSQRQVLARLRFERLLSDFSVKLAIASARECSQTIDGGLRDMAAEFGVDWACRWRPEEDEAWKSPSLRGGLPARCRTLAELPPSLQRRLRNLGVDACAALAIPMFAGESCLGAIWWIARDAALDWDARIDEMRVAGAVVATVLQRKRTEIALEDSHYVKAAILDSMPSHLAVLDAQGVIIAVNQSWTQSGAGNAGLHPAQVSAGTSYLGICCEAAARQQPGAADAVELIQRACRGEATGRHVEYCSGAADCERWFLMTAEPLHRQEGGAVVTHIDITTRKRHEIALRESEDRFRRLADGLPVAVWMSDVTGACTYFNKGWLELTGRTMEQERGEGWLEAVHVADRDGCVGAYVNAFHVRRGFTIEYRLLRHDGEFRWILDSGVPRYGSDGQFHGYVGGCIDITDRKETEQKLRSLTHRLMSAQDDERRRISRDLHDHLSQQLALLAIDLQQLSLQPPSTADAFVPALQEAWRRTTEIASDVHAISHRLHPAKMEALGLVATIRAHCRDLSRQSLPVHFHDQDVPSVPPERALSLFRVVEEALSNIVRHSGAKEAHVALGSIDRTHVLLRIADDGTGFPESRQREGLGLISMRERVEALDGRLSISSTPGRGTVIEVRVPVASSPAMSPDPAPLTARADSA